jgi:hypothetical protein
MDRDSALRFLRDFAAGLRQQGMGYAASGKQRAGLIAQAVAVEAYADRIEATPDTGASVFLLIL